MQSSCYAAEALQARVPGLPGGLGIFSAIGIPGMNSAAWRSEILVEFVVGVRTVRGEILLERVWCILLEYCGSLLFRKMELLGFRHSNCFHLCANWVFLGKEVYWYFLVSCLYYQITAPNQMWNEQNKINVWNPNSKALRKILPFMPNDDIISIRDFPFFFFPGIWWNCSQMLNAMRMQLRMLREAIVNRNIILTIYRHFFWTRNSNWIQQILQQSRENIWHDCYQCDFCRIMPTGKLLFFKSICIGTRIFYTLKRNADFAAGLLLLRGMQQKENSTFRCRSFHSFHVDKAMAQSKEM